MTARSTYKLLRPYKNIIQNTVLPAIQNSGLDSIITFCITNMNHNIFMKDNCDWRKSELSDASHWETSSSALG